MFRPVVAAPAGPDISVQGPEGAGPGQGEEEGPGQGQDRGQLQAAGPPRQDGHQRGLPRQLDPALLRLHPLPGHLS